MFNALCRGMCGTTVPLTVCLFQLFVHGTTEIVSVTNESHHNGSLLIKYFKPVISKSDFFFSML